MNPIVTYDLDYHLSADCKEMQRSKYIGINEDLDSLDRKFTIMGEATMKELNENTIISGGGPRINNLRIKMN